ncbi:MAG: low molecular weight protein-tyrosine-phosphatase [Flavobacteriales bacterium]|jgi:protein-tyrosine phosphatase
MKILMVCLGNICRSPMAQGALEHCAAKKGIEIEVDSAGTSGYHRGEAPDDRAIACMKSHGIDISAQKSRQLRPEDFEVFDRIYAMDRSNLKDLQALCTNSKNLSKIELLLKSDDGYHDVIVPDPYYGSLKDFDRVYEMTMKATERIVASL